jgi:hypothetical protein
MARPPARDGYSRDSFYRWSFAKRRRDWRCKGSAAKARVLKTASPETKTPVAVAIEQPLSPGPRRQRAEEGGHGLPAGALRVAASRPRDHEQAVKAPEPKGPRKNLVLTEPGCVALERPRPKEAHGG